MIIHTDIHMKIMEQQAQAQVEAEIAAQQSEGPPKVPVGRYDPNEELEEE